MKMKANVNVFAKKEKLSIWKHLLTSLTKQMNKKEKKMELKELMMSNKKKKIMMVNKKKKKTMSHLKKIKKEMIKKIVKEEKKNGKCICPYGKKKVKGNCIDKKKIKKIKKRKRRIQRRIIKKWKMYLWLW